MVNCGTCPIRYECNVDEKDIECGRAACPLVASASLLEAIDDLEDKIACLEQQVEKLRKSILELKRDVEWLVTRHAL